MTNYLNNILAHKQKIIQDLIGSGKYNQTISYQSKKSFKKALQNKPAVIAEIKRKSPSKNQLATIKDPAKLALAYIAGGAAAISVLTDEFGFDGSISDLQAVSQAVSHTECVVLQKDFILHPVQINQGIRCGADAILLIVAVLAEKTQSLLDYAKQCRIDAVVEVSNQAELDYAVAIGSEIIAINNRNLNTFDVDVTTAATLRAAIPDSIFSVAASGIDSVATAKHFIERGFHGLLIGECLVTSNDPAAMIQAIGASDENTIN